jgi:hypothetical protein
MFKTVMVWYFLGDVITAAASVGRYTYQGEVALNDWVKAWRNKNHA